MHSTGRTLALLGPRQCEKTTLARMIADREPCEFFDLEDPVDRSRLSAPMTTLQKLSGLVVIDEVQRLPDLFELLRVLVDRPENPARFLLGSASPRLVRGVSESLAGDDPTSLGWRYSFEFKYSDAPRRTRSRHIAHADLAMERLRVVYPGSKEYELDDSTAVVPLGSIPRLADELGAW